MVVVVVVLTTYLQKIQVCIQLPTYADNTPLFARHAAVHRAATDQYIHPGWVHSSKTYNSGFASAARLLLWAYVGTNIVTFRRPCFTWIVLISGISPFTARRRFCQPTVLKH